MAAAKGVLPLASDQMLEALVVLASDEDEEIRAAASATIDTLDPTRFAALASDDSICPDVLEFLCTWPRTPRDMVEALIFNPATPDSALARLAAHSSDPTIIEAISIKQQNLIRSPEIIEAILSNPSRTAEAERRALEVRREFFEKEFGARMVAREQRVRASSRAATQTLAFEDLVGLGLIEEGVDDSILTEYESEFGPFDQLPPEPDQQIEIEQAVSAFELDADKNISPERLPIFHQIALMSVKDRVMLAIKGTREARMILVRDPNRVVAVAVLRNPRLTDAEVEYIASIKTVPEDVLRQIGQNRMWIRSYGVIHNLVRNPRTPIAISLGLLNRIQTRDLRALSTNKNIPDVIRTTASRLYIKRNTGAA
jgi:hypothetical protein